MTQENAKAQPARKCKLLKESVTTGCAVIMAQSSKPKVPLQKRKEEAKKTLYLNRI